MVKQKINTHIRWMIRRDLPEILNIESKCYDDPWKEEDFLQALRSRNCIGMIVELSDKIVGFMIYDLEKNKINILNFAVHPDYHRKGIGTQMIDKLKCKLSSNGKNTIALQTRESNLIAQLFFRAQGFKAVKVLRNFYEDTGEDGYRFKYKNEVIDA